MKKVFACIVVVAILIVSFTSSASLSHAFARSESVSFGIEAENIIFISRGDGAYIRESYYFKVCADHTGSNTLGDITRTAITKYVAENDFSDKKNLVTLFEFVLLGDPALEIPAQQLGYSYQQPVSTAIEPAGYVAETYGNIPWYNTNTSITIHTTTDSAKVYTKRIDTHANTVVERLENNTVGGAFDYTFTSPIETEYLVRTTSEDGKEGWLYVRVFFTGSQPEHI